MLGAPADASRRSSSRRRRGSGIGCAANCSARASALHALPALVDSRWTIGDLGCGTGETSAALAPFVARTVAVDRSGEMLQAARRRLRDLPNVDVRRGELEALPIADGELDAAVMMLVLHHVPDPGAVLQEAARTLKPRGRFVLCDMLPHDREEYKQQMGHVWLGFGDDQLRRLLGAAGFDDIRIVPLPVGSGAKGPALFVASAFELALRHVGPIQVEHVKERR